MMTQHDIEISRIMATAWKLNDERNKRIEAEQKLEAEARKEFAAVDDAAQE